MVITKSIFNILSYGSLVLVAIIFVFIYTQNIPDGSFLYLSIISIILLIGRIIFRIIYLKQNKNINGG